MLDEHRFGHHGTGAAGTGEPGDCRQQMQEQDGQIAHRIILARSRHTQELLTNFGIRHAHVLARAEAGHAPVAAPRARVPSLRLACASRSLSVRDPNRLASATPARRSYARIRRAVQDPLINYGFSCSCARAPRSINSGVWFPSWHAYSKMRSSVLIIVCDAVHGRVNATGSSIVYS